MCTGHYNQVHTYGEVRTKDVRSMRERGSDSPTYPVVHIRLKKLRGPASLYPCAECGAQARQWAFDNLEPQWINPETGCAYYGDLDRYRPLCLKCHRAERSR